MVLMLYSFYWTIFLEEIFFRLDKFSFATSKFDEINLFVYVYTCIMYALIKRLKSLKYIGI